MAMPTKQSIIPHGVVFLYDPTTIIDVPEDTGTLPILNTDNCISIWTIQEDEGLVTLSLSKDFSDATGCLVFKGMLDTKGKKISFNSSDGNSIIDIEVLSTKTELCIFTNHDHYPDSVNCIILDHNK